MKNNNKTDYDRIAEELGSILERFTGNTHEPNEHFGDSITMTKDGFIGGVVKLQRLRTYVEGLSKTYKATKAPEYVDQRVLGELPRVTGQTKRNDSGVLIF